MSCHVWSVMLLIVSGPRRAAWVALLRPIANRGQVRAHTPCSICRRFNLSCQSWGASWTLMDVKRDQREGARATSIGAAQQSYTSIKHLINEKKTHPELFLKALKSANLKVPRGVYSADKQFCLHSVFLTKTHSVVSFRPWKHVDCISNIMRTFCRLGFECFWNRYCLHRLAGFFSLYTAAFLWHIIAANCQYAPPSFADGRRVYRISPMYFTAIGGGGMNVCPHAERTCDTNNAMISTSKHCNTVKESQQYFKLIKSVFF